MSERIMIVDDEKDIANLIEIYMQNEKFEVKKFYSSYDALKFLQYEEVDLAILDIMMDGLNGYELCQKIREQYNFPIIMLTAKDEEIDKIKGLTLGADDYITKPFQPLELVARVKAQLRRYKSYNGLEKQKTTKVLEYRELYLNLQTHECTLNNEMVSLTPTEFMILKVLLENEGNVVTGEKLFHAIWEDEYYNKNNNTINVHIRNIREKLKDNAGESRYIKTVWGIGYKI